MRGPGLALLVCLVPFAAFAQEGLDGKLDQIERDLEIGRYQALARVQADTHNQQAPFSTDGCSGGLSDGWRYLAMSLPAFKNKFGDKPPYEQCCVEHDRAYWQGETAQGFAKRLAADNRLQQCVADYGKTHRQEFAAEFHLSPAVIEGNFRIVAALMYRAVRLGGLPCTPFPWRWGYGWPPCHVQDE